jgi:hypothetical protein
MTANPAMVSLNQKNKLFWQGQKVQMERRMADAVIRESAFELICAELQRRMPTRYQTPIELALAGSERLKYRFLRQQARIGGKASKADPLNELIAEIVRRRPTVTEFELLQLLRQEQGIGKIQDIDEEAIWFATRGGGLKSAKISGLKDRLSRAKRHLRSR